MAKRGPTFLCSLQSHRPGPQGLGYTASAAPKLPWGFLGSSSGKESACNAGDLGSIPGLEDPMEEGMAIHSSILAWRIPMDRGAWPAIVHWGHKESDTTERLSTAPQLQLSLPEE